MRYVLILSALLVSCGHPERYGCNVVQNTLQCLDGKNYPLPVDGTDGQDGANAEPCTVIDTAAGAEIVCPDGTSVEILDGDDGKTIICHKRRHRRVCTVR